jgi:hypothetical protein
MMQILLRAFSGKVAFRFSAENATAQEASGQWAANAYQATNRTPID